MRKCHASSLKGRPSRIHEAKRQSSCQGQARPVRKAGSLTRNWMSMYEGKYSTRYPKRLVTAPPNAQALQGGIPGASGFLAPANTRPAIAARIAPSAIPTITGPSSHTLTQRPTPPATPDQKYPVCHPPIRENAAQKQQHAPERDDLRQAEVVGDPRKKGRSQRKDRRHAEGDQHRRQRPEPPRHEHGGGDQEQHVQERVRIQRGALD